VFSAAKLFFAYGLGNALTFPLAVGATSVLYFGAPDAGRRRARSYCAAKRPTIFCGVPTLFGSLLASPGPAGARRSTALRLCTSAGEPLPEEIGKRWTARTGVEIVDGIGSTEMLHIFVSNRPGAVKYGTTGKPVPGYAARIVGEFGGDRSRSGELGELRVSRGPTSPLLLLEQSREDAPHVCRRVDAHRRQVRVRRRTAITSTAAAATTC
jgi:benzoate-CoA ligase